MIVSYNVKLAFPDEETKGRYEKVLSAERDCYNYLSKKFEEIDFVHNKLTRYDVQSCYYRDLRSRFPELSSQMVLKCILEAVSNWKSAIRNCYNGFEVPYKKNLSMVLDKRLYGKLTASSVELTVPGGRRARCTFSPYPKLAELLDFYRVQNCNVFFRLNQAWLTLQFEVPRGEDAGHGVLGIDRGMRRIVACSDNTGWIDREFNKKRRRLRYLRRCLRSRNSKSAKRHLKRLSRTERNRSRNEIHRVVNWLLTKPVHTYVVEDLSKIKKRTSKKKVVTPAGVTIEVKKRKHNNRFGQVPLKEIQSVLEYKAQLLGKEVATVEPAYTSLLDSRGMPQGIRQGTRYRASDGVLLDADINAASNIALRHRPDSIVANPVYGSAVFSGRPTSTGQSWTKLRQNPQAHALQGVGS